MSVGSRRKTCVTFGPKRMRSVLSAAAAKRVPQSLCHVSSTEYTAWNPSSSAVRIISIESASG
jgi:hypothetical protein